MVVIVVSRALEWLETQTFGRVCFLSDSLSMLRKISGGWGCKQWLKTEKVQADNKSVSFLCQGTWMLEEMNELIGMLV